MKVLTYPCGPIQANTYILYAEGQPNCLVIDPADGKKITKAIQDTGLTCTHILLTHGHFDHVWGVKAVKEATGAPVYMSREDLDLVSGKGPFFSAMQQVLKPFAPDVFIGEGDMIEAAGLKLAVAEDKDVEQKLGDLLFAAVQVARAAGIDPENALGEASRRFTQRVLLCEEMAAQDGRGLKQLDEGERRALWQRAEKQLSEGK